MKATNSRFERRRGDRAERDGERSEILQRLNRGGALQGLQMLQHSLTSKEAQLKSLQEQTVLLDRIQGLKDEVQRELLDFISIQVGVHEGERRPHWNTAVTRTIRK